MGGCMENGVTMCDSLPIRNSNNNSNNNGDVINSNNINKVESLPVSARELASSVGTFEVVLTFEGTTPETGNTVQVRTSYVPGEILWGYRFEHKCVSYDKAMNKYAVSYTAINSFIPDRTPRCSAKVWEARKLLNNYEESSD